MCFSVLPSWQELLNIPQQSNSKTEAKHEHAAKGGYEVEVHILARAVDKNVQYNLKVSLFLFSDYLYLSLTSLWIISYS